jgi:hypothetical protein
LGIFLDVLAHAWKEKDEDETFARIEAVLAKAASYGVSACSYFSFLHTGKREHKHLNFKTPWEINSDNLFMFHKNNDRFWHLSRRFKELLKKYEIKDAGQGFMWNYTFIPFEININNITSFFDPLALSVQKIYCRKFVKDSLQIFSAPQYFKPLNEARHGGSDEKGHWIADWHRDIFHAVETWISLEHYICDASLSEYAFCQLIEHSPDHRNCAKCGKPWDNPAGYDRRLIQERHGVSIIDDLEDMEKYVSLAGFLRSAWHYWKLSEDGSNRGNIVPIPGMSWRLGDADQIYKMLVEAWSRCRDHKRKKETIFGLFPMETFIKHDWGIEEWYDVDSINQDRFEAVQKAHKEVYKP